MQRSLPPGARRFAKYASVGFATFAFDLALLGLLVERAGFAFYLAIPLCFVIASTINYAVSRRHVFRGTERAWRRGYAYFLLSAGMGAFISTSGVALLLALFPIHYLIARTLVAAGVGIFNYLFNLRFNFRVMGIHR